MIDAVPRYKMAPRRCGVCFWGRLPNTVALAPLLGERLSFKAQQWALEQDDLRCPDKFVLFMLAYRDNPDEPHGCFPSLNRIAKDCGLSRSTVQESIQHLIECGKIKMEHRQGTKGHPSSNYYTLPGVYREAVHPTMGVGRQPVYRIPPRGTGVYRHAVPNSIKRTKNEHSRSALPITPSEEKDLRDQFFAEVKRIAGAKAL